MEFKYCNNTTINYEVHGNGSLSIVAVHGYGTSLESWRETQDALSKNSTLYLLDLKGFGKSSKPLDDKYRADHQAEIIAAFIEANNLKDVVLVGHSYGGAIVLLTYFRMKGKDSPVKKIVVIDPAIYLNKMPLLVTLAKRKFINWLMINIIPDTLISFITLKFLFYNGKKIPPGKVEKFAGALKSPGAYHSFVLTADLMVPYLIETVVPMLKDVDLPVLIIWGKNDPLIPARHSHGINTAIKNSQLVMIDKCGHIPQSECPAETAKAIINFLKN